MNPAVGWGQLAADKREYARGGPSAQPRIVQIDWATDSGLVWPPRRPSDLLHEQSRSLKLRLLFAR